MKDDREREDSGEDGEDEADEEEALDGEKPRGHQPLPDLVVSVSPHRVTSCEQYIKLEPGEAEPVEADLPGPHANER